MEDDKDFLKIIYENHIKDLYAYGLSCHSDITIIEDSIHDLFIDIYQHKEKLEKVKNLKYYLMSALRYTIHLQLKKGGLTTAFEKAEDYEGFFERDVQEAYIEQEEEAGQIQIVGELLSRLNAHQREILHLRFSEGLSFSEIAELMQINRQSAQNLFQRSIDKLKEEILRSNPNKIRIK